MAAPDREQGRLVDYVGQVRAAKTRRSPLRAQLGIALLMAGPGALLVASYFDAEPTAERVEGDFLVTTRSDVLDISSHNSPVIAHNPADGANVVIANRVDTPRFSCALHVSFDGGASFRPVPIPIPEEEGPKCYAPDVAFGPDGKLYLAYLTLKGRGNVPNALWVSTFTDGGRTLRSPLQARGPLSFQARLLADPRVEDRLYLTWLQAEDTATIAFPETGYPVLAAVSEDGGESWSDPVRISDPARERVVAPSPAVGADGRLYVAYLDLLDDRLDYHGGHQGREGPP